MFTGAITLLTPAAFNDSLVKRFGPFPSRSESRYKNRKRRGCVLKNKRGWGKANPDLFFKFFKSPQGGLLFPSPRLLSKEGDGGGGRTPPPLPRFPRAPEADLNHFRRVRRRPRGRCSAACLPFREAGLAALVDLPPLRKAQSAPRLRIEGLRPSPSPALPDLFRREPRRLPGGA